MNDVRDGAPETEPVSAGGLLPGEADGAASLDSQEDFVHESVELPDWIPVAFGLILITIAAAAIWMAS